MLQIRVIITDDERGREVDLTDHLRKASYDAETRFAPVREFAADLMGRAIVAGGYGEV